MKPYYSNEFVTLYHGDCREILSSLPHCETLVTDPVWPNAIAKLEGSDRPFELLAEMFGLISPERAAIHLGCDSDPRILSAVNLSFFRVAWLRYSCPGKKGRLLQGADVAYLFGNPPKSRNGYHLIPGEVNVSKAGKETKHPCPRKLKHVSWLLDKWSNPGDTILDPFCGSGTTLLAAYQRGQKAIGIEIKEEFCEMAANRFGQQNIYQIMATTTYEQLEAIAQ